MNVKTLEVSNGGDIIKPLVAAAGVRYYCRNFSSRVLYAFRVVEGINVVFSTSVPIQVVELAWMVIYYKEDVPYHFLFPLDDYLKKSRV